MVKSGSPFKGLALTSINANLMNKASSGFLWMTSRQIIIQFVLLLKLFVVARVLGPELYGSFIIILLLSSITLEIINLRVELAVVNAQEPSSKYLNTAWTTQILQGLIVLSFTLVVANLYNYYLLGGNYVLELNILIFAFFFQNFTNIGVAYFLKNLEYRLEFWYRMTPITAGTIFVVILIQIWPNIWILVLGILIEKSVLIILSYTLSNYRPRFCFDKIEFRKIISYGWSLIFFQLFGIVLLQGNELLVGSILGLSSLALFQVGFKISTLPLSYLADVSSTITIPTYAKLQTDPDTLRALFQYMVSITFYLFSLFSLLLFLYRSQFIVLIFRNEWLEIIAYIPYLIVIGLFTLLRSHIEQLFLGVGIHKKLLRYLIVRFMLFFALFYPVATVSGIEGIFFLIILSQAIEVIGIGFEGLQAFSLFTLTIRFWKSMVIYLTIIPTVVLSIALQNRVEGLSIVNLLVEILFSTLIFMVFTYLIHLLIPNTMISQTYSLFRNFRSPPVTS